MEPFDPRELTRRSLLRAGLAAPAAALLSGCSQEEDARLLLEGLTFTPVTRTTGPYLQMDAPDSVLVNWFTTSRLVGQVELTELGEGAGEPQVFTEAQAVKQHSVRLTGLQPGRRYSYRLIGETATDGGAIHPLKPPKAPGETIIFAVTGDTGQGSVDQVNVANQMVAADVDYILHVGDVVYPKGSDTDYDAHFFEPYKGLIDRAVIFPCIGNHDVNLWDGGPYLQNFVLPGNGPAGVQPERCYSINLGDVHIVSIDRTREQAVIRERIMPWLREDLAGAGNRWKFVYFHFPLYASGRLNRNEPPVDLDLWTAIFDEHDVDLCFAGHFHHYERSHPVRGGQIVAPGEGTVYVLSGNGGSDVSPMMPPGPFSAARNDQAFGFAKVTVQGENIRIEEVNWAGDVLDDVAWTKPGKGA